MHVCIYTCMCVCIYTRIYIIHGFNMDMGSTPYMHVCIYTCIYMCVYTCVYIWVYVSVCIYVHLCVYTLTHIKYSDPQISLWEKSVFSRTVFKPFKT